MQSIETACDYTSFEIYSSSHSVLNSERELKKLCTNPETGSDLRSLLAVSRLLHQTRLKKQEKACDQMIIYNYRLDSAAEELSKSKPLIIRQGDTIDVTSVKEVLAASVSRQATIQQEKAPGHWFHVNTYCDSDLQAIVRFGEELSISSSVIANTMENYSRGMTCAEQGPECVGIAFVDIVRVDEGGLEVAAPKHLMRASSKVGASGNLMRVMNRNALETERPDDPRVLEEPSLAKTDSRTTNRQLPIAVFYSSRTNACLSVRAAPTGQEAIMSHWNGIVRQLEAKTSLVHNRMDAAYLMFLLIADVVNSIEPLLSTYGDALEGLDFLFDEYEPTARRNLMSRKLQKDLWVIRRWGWSMETIAEDLLVDAWHIFTTEQERPIKLLSKQCRSLSEIAKAFITKAESQEDFFSHTQEETTNNLLFNLTICTMIMVPPQFFTGIYGMNFDVMPELRNPHGYFILWGWCAPPRISACIPLGPCFFLHLSCLRGRISRVLATAAWALGGWAGSST